MKVEKWTNWTDAESIAKKNGENCSFDAVVAVVDDLKTSGRKFGGYCHQSDQYNGVPVFDTGEVMMASMRRWGEIVADAFGGFYTDYAWKGELTDEKV